MAPPIVVRPARIDDVPALARVIVTSWRETYRGIMRDEVLDDPDLVAARERFWTAVFEDERYAANRASVAERDGEVIGVAMSGVPLDTDATWPRQLYVLYVLAAEHGSGAGHTLLEAVAPAGEDVALWVADPNPRAQAFYLAHGFAFDGAVKIEDGVTELRMVRVARPGEGVRQAG
ncbi:GNAT family N-acetyltransferase [Microbacterium sp.]|uniref:GNAT family N-acetyltransferase n=1 Tax=Microbacterium sp. TaxID=51671 RepID=UPI0039E5332B